MCEVNHNDSLIYFLAYILNLIKIDAVCIDTVELLLSILLIQNLTLHPPKPCEYFDMIEGTSIDELIIIMLSCLEMNIDEYIDVYNALFDRVFQKKAASRFNKRTCAEEI